MRKGTPNDIENGFLNNSSSGPSQNSTAHKLNEYYVKLKNKNQHIYDPQTI